MEVVVISGKGGTGKTTIAAYLAKKLRWFTVDADVDTPNLHIALGYDPARARTEELYEGRVARVKGKGDVDPSVCPFGAIGPGPTVNPWICEGCGVCAVEYPHLFELVPVKNATIRFWDGDPPLLDAELEPGRKNSGRIVDILLSRAEEPMLVDGPAGVGCPVISALKRANLAILVVNPTIASIHDAERVLSLLSHFGVPHMLVVNRADLSESYTRQAEDTLEGLAVFHVPTLDALLGTYPTPTHLLNPYLEGLARAVVDLGEEGKEGDKQK